MTFIIAEAGINHNGRLLTALELIDAAVEAKADAVKFQMFDSQKLWGDDRITKYQLAKIEWETLVEHCLDAGIEFMCTPFGVEELKRCVDLGVKRIKISSGMVTNLDLISAARRTKLPVILSTGMSTEKEVCNALLALCGVKCMGEDVLMEPGRHTLLQCTSAYPCEPADVHLRAMIELRETLVDNVGLSDHTLSLAIPAAAVALGAQVIEKHLTLSRNQEGPDHKASLEPDEFAQMVRGIREVEQALGDGIKKVQPSEEPLRRLWRDKR